MAGIHLNLFGGVVEKIAPDLIKDELAVAAVNARTDSGKLSSFRQNTQVVALTLGAPISLYRYQPDKWFEWQEDVDVAKSPQLYDVTDTVIFTGQDYPRITRNDVALGPGRLPNASYRLGIPAPAAAPTVAETVPSADPDALEEDRYYVYTLVDAWGREGPPSLASAAVTTKDGATIQVTMGVTPTGNYNFGAGALRRIYRTNTGTSDTAFQFVAEVTIATTVFNDTVLNRDLAEVLITTEWDGPPDDDAGLYPSGPMVGLVALPNGVLAGFSGNTLCLSEPYVPHAFPVAYRRPVPDDIVALVPTDAGLVVLTEGKPWIAVGSDPSAIHMQELDENQACVSKRSAVDMGGMAIFASPDGLVAVDSGNVVLLTESILTREQWQAYNPSQLRAFRYENKYVAFNDAGGFIFTPGASIDAAFMPIDFTANGGYYDLLSDTLFLIEGTNVVSFDTGAARNASWQSKTFVFPEETAMQRVQVQADAYPIGLDLTVDGVTSTVSISSKEPKSLPVLQGYEWSVKVNPMASTVRRIHLATSMAELRNG